MNIINNKDNEDYKLYKEEDAQIDAKFAEITKVFNENKTKKMMYERVKNNIHDIEYYGALAPEYWTKCFQNNDKYK